MFANRRSACFNIEMLIMHDLKCHLDQDPEVFLKFCCLLNLCWKVIGLFFIILTGVGWHYPIICKRRNVQILESKCSGKLRYLKIIAVWKILVRQSSVQKHSMSAVPTANHAMEIVKKTAWISLVASISDYF